MKWFLSLLALCIPASAQFIPHAPPKVGYCLNPSKVWIPIATQVTGSQLANGAPATDLYGINGVSFYALACDASGNLTPGGGPYLPLAGGVLNGATGGNPIAGGINATQYEVNGIPVTVPPVAALTVEAEYPFTDQTGTTFADISGNGNNGTLCAGVNAPSWNGDGLLILGVVSGNYQCATTPLTTFKGVLIAYTAWPNGQLSTLTPTTTGTGNPGLPSAAFNTLLGTTNTASNGVIIANPTGDPSTVIQPGIYNQTSGSFTTYCNVGAPGNHILFYIPDASTDHVILDGVECAYGAQAGTSASVTTTGTYVFGVAKVSNSLSGRFTLRYAKFYSTAEPTVAQAVQETAYVQGILNNRTKIPKYPQFAQTLTNNVIGVGDSLTAGYAGSAVWFNSTYIVATNTYTFLNYGIAGMLARDISWNGPVRWFSGINPTRGVNYCHIWAGTNDELDTIPAATVYGYLVSIGVQARKLGCLPIVATMISRSGLATQKNALNTIIRQNWQKDGFAALDDLAEVPVLGSDTAYTNTPACFQADGVHLEGPGAGTCANSLSGYSLTGLGVSTLINALDGFSDANPFSITSTTALTSADRTTIANCGAVNCTITLPDCSYMTGQKFKVINATSGIGVVTLAPFSGQDLYASASSITLLSSTTTVFTDTLTGPTTGGCYWTY